MKYNFLIAYTLLFLVISCNKDEKILNILNDYNLEMESKGYRFGDQIKLPKEVTDAAEKIILRIEEKETSQLIIDPAFFTLGDNVVSFEIHQKNGKVLNQDATINVYSKNPLQKLTYSKIKEYPQVIPNFVQGFQLEGNTIYQSDGQFGSSKISKYDLGSSTFSISVPQPNDIFSEGMTIFRDKIYQLTWQNKKGFIYKKSDLSMIQEFVYPNSIAEGWGLTTDGENLILSDGTKNLYFLDAENPSKVIRKIGVASDSEIFDQINELEFYKGFVYANVWHKPIILKINPANGEVVASLDLAELAKKHLSDPENVLNGITFKGENMLVTGKNWDKIYEISIK